MFEAYGILMFNEIIPFLGYSDTKFYLIQIEEVYFNFPIKQNKYFANVGVFCKCLFLLILKIEVLNVLNC